MSNSLFILCLATECPMWLGTSCALLYHIAFPPELHSTVQYLKFPSQPGYHTKVYLKVSDLNMYETL